MSEFTYQKTHLIPVKENGQETAEKKVMVLKVVHKEKRAGEVPVTIVGLLNHDGFVFTINFCYLRWELRMKINVSFHPEYSKKGLKVKFTIHFPGKPYFFHSSNPTKVEASCGLLRQSILFIVRSANLERGN